MEWTPSGAAHLGQNLGQHAHVHALVAGAALAPDGTLRRANPGFLFPVQALSRVFRAKYLDTLQQAFAQDKLRFGGTTQALREPQAFAAFVADWRLVANFWLRPGNTGSADNAHSFIEATLANLGVTPVGLFRADSGFYNQTIVNLLKTRKIAHIISARLTQVLQQAIVDKCA